MGNDGVILGTTEVVADRGPWIQTYTGGRMYFRNPRDEEIDIRDIAHALSNQCRFAGHTLSFYSVAEHSVYVSYLALNPLEGLLHDASEAYLVDMPSPIKKELQSYRDVEETIMKAVASKFNFSWPISADTHDADRAQLVEEARTCLKYCEWINDPIYKTNLRQFGIVPMGHPPHVAEQMFLNRFRQVRTYVSTQ